MPQPTISLDAAQHSGEFLALSSIAGIAVDLRYASSNNFLGRDVYSPMDCAWLHQDAAKALARAQVWLGARAGQHRLVVLDALRPHCVQVAMYDALQGTGLELYLAHPDRGSIHSFGMAVDVSVLDARGHALDMGSGFDAMQPESHPEFEAQHLATGALTAQHVANRNLLRGAMFGAGFRGISTEWWHFDFGDKVSVRETHARVD